MQSRQISLVYTDLGGGGGGGGGGGDFFFPSVPETV